MVTKQIASLLGAKRRQQFMPGDNLELDLGLDSLKRLELLCRLEEAFSISLPEQTLASVQTVGDMYGAVMERKTAAAASDAHGDNGAPNLRQRISSDSANLPDISLSTDGSGKRFISETLPRIAFSLSTAIWNPSIYGRELLVSAGPVIFCANHESYLDILWLLYALPLTIRDTTFAIGKSAYLRSPLLRPFVTKAFIPAGQGADIVNTLTVSLSILKKGHNLIIFPEGTRTRTGRMNPFKSGVGMLVRETNAAIIPVKIKGTYALWPAGKFPKLLGRRKYRPLIAFGKRLTLEKLIAMGKCSFDSTDDQIAACIRGIIEEM
jgi:long-chain acyl-CoA synthetase